MWVFPTIGAFSRQDLALHLMLTYALRKFGQELLSTFGTTIGEISLIPATGGIFTVNLVHCTTSQILHMQR